MLSRSKLYTWLKYKKSVLAKFIGFSAATAVTFRLLFHESFAYEKSKLDDDKLIFVLMLTRHGARTPLHIISGLEEVEYKPELMENFVKAKYKLKTLNNQDFDDILSKYDQRNFNLKLKGGIGRGQLTYIGEKQMFDLGQKLKKRYIDELKFLPKTYDPNQVYTRSTHFKRTINSAKSVLAGMFVNSPDETPEEPFIINVGDLHQEYLFPNVLGCTYYAEALEFMQKLELYKNKDYMENLAALNSELKSFVNKENLNYNFTAFRDDMSARKIHDLPVPKKLEPLFKKSEKYSCIELSAQHNFNIKLASGQLLNLIKSNLIDIVEMDKQNTREVRPRFRYYSAHDSTLNALLIAFNLEHENMLWPPFAADLIIEVWKENASKTLNNKDDYYINIRYCGRTIIPTSCNDTKKNGCKLDDFIKIISKHSVDRHEFNAICNQKFEA